MTTTQKSIATGCAIVGATLALAVPAAAQDVTERALIDPGGYDPYAPETITPYGMSVTGGAGVTGFTDEAARDFSSVGGGWNVRFALGTRSIIAGEIAYLGSGQDVDALGLDNSANLLANGGEIAARLNILPGLVQPYVLAGVGYTHYELVGEDFNNSSVEESDDVAHFPVGAGVGLRYEGFIADARGTFRPVAGGSLFEAGGGELHNWGANLNAGVEF